MAINTFPGKESVVERDPSVELKAENARLIALLEANDIQWRAPLKPVPPVSMLEPSRLSTHEKVALLAAGLSDQQAVKPDSKSDAKLEAWIAELPTAENAAMLKLLLTGHAQQAERRLRLRYLAWQREQRPKGEAELRRRRIRLRLYRLGDNIGVEQDH